MLNDRRAGTQHGHRAGRHHHQRTLAPARPAPLHPMPGNYAPALARPDAPHNACQPPPFSRSCSHFATEGGNSARRARELHPSQPNDADADGAFHRGAVSSRRAPLNGTAPPLSAPASLSHPSESRASRLVGGTHEEALQSPRLTPLARGDLRHFSSARVTRAPQLTSLASPRRESIPVWIWPSTC